MCNGCVGIMHYSSTGWRRGDEKLYICSCCVPSDKLSLSSIVLEAMREHKWERYIAGWIRT